MKKLSLIVILFIGYVVDAQNVIVAENINNGISRELNTGSVICSNLSAKVVIDIEKDVVTLTVDKKEASYYINETIIYGAQTILNCSNESQNIQVIYDDVHPNFITVSEVDSDFAFFVDIIKHKNLNLRNNGTTKKKPEKVRS